MGPNFFPAGFSKVFNRSTSNPVPNPIKDIDIPYAPLISITYGNLQTLISNRQISPGQHYLINDKGDEGVIVTGATDSSVSEEAIANMLNADFQKVGDYSGISGFVFGTNLQLGIWTIALTPNKNDICIWNNDHYINKLGANDITSPDIDGVNWKKISTRDVVSGFIRESRNIMFSMDYGLWFSEKDFTGNDVFGNHHLFPWGNTLISKTTALLGNTNTDLRNFLGSMNDNNFDLEFGASAIIADNTTTAQIITTTIKGDALNPTTVDFTNCEGSITNCWFSNGCHLTIPMQPASALTNIKIHLPFIISFDPNTTLTDITIENGFSNYTGIIDITALDTIDLVTNEAAGIISLFSSNATETIKTISMSQEYFPVRFYVEPGLTVTFISLGITGIKLVGGGPAIINGTTGDWIEFQSIGGVIYETNKGQY